MSWIGVDFGAKRVGIAVSQSGTISTPLQVIDRARGLDAVIETIVSIAAEYEADTVIVGIPRGGRKAHSDNLDLYEGFASMLRERTELTVELWDESYTTTEASRLAREAGHRRTPKDRIDAMAAAVILQSWLDSRGGRS
jgi:putative Holliday junction resolvase